MGRLVRSRLKTGINMRRDSYFLVVSCTSLLLYAICLYTFLHLNGYIGVKNLVSVSSPSTVTGARHLDPNDVDKNSLFAAPYLKSQAQFDDGKIHEFQRNVGHPVDWEMRVKGNHFYNPRLPSFFQFDTVLGHVLYTSCMQYTSILPNTNNIAV